MDFSDLKLTDVGVPLFSVCWLAREFFGFARQNTPKPLAANADADVAEEEMRPLSPGIRRQPYSRLDIYIPALIAVCFYLFAIWRLATPNEQIFDEVHHARSAMEYVDGLVPHEWSHPPFSKEMIALSIKVWHGEFDPRDGVWKQDVPYPARDAVGWRFASVLFGTLTLPALYFLTRVLFRNRAVATIAAIMLALDGAFFVQSRVAMTNIFTLFFITLSAGFLALFLQQPRPRWLLATGIAMGFAIASRWSSLYAWAVMILLLAIQWFADATRSAFSDDVEEDTTEDKAPARESVRNTLPGLRLLGLGFLCLIVVPFVIYFATYLPNMLQGPGPVSQKLFTWNGLNNLGWAKMFSMQHDMYEYHATLVAEHPYASPWWSWPLELRPVWYYFKSVGPNYIAGVWCIGNVFLWWASVPAFLTLGYLSWRYETRRGGGLGPLSLVAALGLGQWLAWGVKARGLDFMHYYFECIPFACVALAYLGYRMWTSEAGTPSTQRLRKVFVGVYALAYFAWFVFFYPLLSAFPISAWYYGQHLWLGRLWI